MFESSTGFDPCPKSPGRAVSRSHCQCLSCKTSFLSGEGDREAQQGIKSHNQWELVASLDIRKYLFTPAAKHAGRSMGICNSVNAIPNSREYLFLSGNRGPEVRKTGFPCLCCHKLYRALALLLELLCLPLLDGGRGSTPSTSVKHTSVKSNLG